jgi:hypothetical protein
MDELRGAAALAARRAWHAGLPARAAVEQYMLQALEDGATARGVLGSIRRRLQRLARSHATGRTWSRPYLHGDDTKRAPEMAEAFAASQT